MVEGFLNLVLHAHLPFVRHPEYAEFLEEGWLYEAISETYIPLLDMMGRLVGEGVPFRLSMTLSPPLLEMLADPLLQDRYACRVKALVELSARELDRTRDMVHFNDSARMYHDHFTKARDFFNSCGGNLVRPFRDLQERGVLEILTCTATHGLLPLVQHPAAREAQVRVAVANYEKHFARRPRGIWLAECGYDPGVDAILARNRIEYFVTDTHAVLFGRPRPRCGAFAPVRSPAGPVAFPRDSETHEEVWSSQRGYPGDYDYREFYRDLGYDADYDYIRPYLHADGVRRNTGIKYHRVTGAVDLGDKKPYIPAVGLEKAARHAGDFIEKRAREISRVKDLLGHPPLLTAPFDAELFGHWWFEGPMFLEYLVRKLAFDQDAIQMVCPSEYLSRCPDMQDQQPILSTWGAEGYLGVWLNGKTDWVYRHLYMAENRMAELAQSHPDPGPLARRALNQAARELLLAQSSDWPFIMTTGTTVPYAVKRFKDHVHRFTSLYHDIRSGRVDEGRVAELENLDTIFQEIDYLAYV